MVSGGSGEAQPLLDEADEVPIGVGTAGSPGDGTSRSNPFLGVGSIPGSTPLCPGPLLPIRVGLDSLLVRVCSWNVGEADPDECPPDRFRDWLLGGTEGIPSWSDRALNQPDVIAVGLQEVDMSCCSMLHACFGRQTTRGHSWQAMLHRVLTDGERYELLDSIQLGGLQVMLFAKGPQLLRRLGEVDVSTVPSGFCGGLCWNKGTTSCRIKIDAMGPDDKGVSICFVNSHFAAKAAKLERRNWEHDRVCDRTTFRAQPRKIHDHDAVFWFGDLNYRLDMPKAQSGGKSRQEVKEALKQESLAHSTAPEKLVLRCDQLADQINKGRVFGGYSEARIDFRPTYKVLPGQGKHDMRRQPSYTDRVLYYAKDTPETGDDAGRIQSPTARNRMSGLGTSPYSPAPSLRMADKEGATNPSFVGAPTRPVVVCLEYSAIEDMPIADHRPIHALFAMPGRLPGTAT
eukprot:Hpha_TRINITY_DN12112_c0_g1::TRINITY_DN12112_c0_g1_i1::g.82142::m.82142/K20279/SYNJ; synaptojanin